MLDIFSCVDLFLCSHPEITKSVKKIFNKNALDFPYYVDDIDNKITNKKLNGFYIGGTLNEYRKLFLGKKGKYIISMMIKRYMKNISVTLIIKFIDK